MLNQKRITKEPEEIQLEQENEEIIQKNVVLNHHIALKN
jgi:hypothetical protein